MDKEHRKIPPGIRRSQGIIKIFAFHLALFRAKVSGFVRKYLFDFFGPDCMFPFQLVFYVIEPNNMFDFHSFLESTPGKINLSIPCAARFPSAAAFTTSFPPLIQSPPAKYFGLEVCIVAESTIILPFSNLRFGIGVTKLSFAFCPIDLITISTGIRKSEF